MDQRTDPPHQSDTPDPLDAEAAEIDPRSPEAAEDVEDLVEHAEELGREPDQEVDADPVEG